MPKVTKKPVANIDAEKAIPKKAVKPAAKSPQLLRGFKDILPSDQPYWQHVESVAQSFAEAYSFGTINPPLLEETKLFTRTIGEATDIVEKEMFTFTDASDGSVSLRPEFTASIARAYISHGMLSWPQPVKLFYFGSAFRRERPQSGRYRQFTQMGMEILGDQGPIVDAELIKIVYDFFQALGLNVSMQVNSIGTAECRKAYKQELVAYFRSKRKMLSEDDKQRLKKNPLRILDSKDENIQALKADAPQIVDWLDDESKAHFMKVIEYLDELDIPYVLNPYLVRGLDYYTKTVFEVWPEDQHAGSQTALGGGGRYDALIEQLGGRPTPAAGYALGVERIIMLLKERGVEIPTPQPPAIFLAQIGDQAKMRAVKLFDSFRAQNVKVAESFTRDSLKSQLELAGKLAVKYVLIIGQKEVGDGTVLIRDMESGVQEVVDYNKAVNEVKKKLATMNGQLAR